MHHKATLPTKTCLVCQRPFAWRKKWERDWEQVLYCSERCRREPKASAAPIGPGNVNRKGNRT